jgi:predicted ATP-binding protein involved in virulence
MILEHLELRHFRGFEHLSVAVDRHLTVFIGNNGAGKTAVLDSIALLLVPVLSRLPIQKRGKVPSLAQSDIRLIEEDQAAPFVQVACVGRDKGSGQIAWDRIRLRDPSARTRREAPAKRRDTRDLYRHLDEITDAHNDKRPYRLPVFAFYGTNRAVDIPRNRLYTHAIPKYFRRLAGLENALETKSDFRRAIAWFEFFEQRELRARRDEEISGSHPGLDAVRRAVQSMIPELRGPRIDANRHFVVDARDPSGKLIRLHLDQLSDGYQVMLGVVMDFALRLALANPPETVGGDVLASEAILMIDEVDLHLHPAWQQRVIPDLRRTFPNTQIIVSTHSPQVLSTVRAESIRILEHAAEGGWRARTPQEQTRGVESAYVMASVMGIDPVPPLEEPRWLSDYRALIETGQSESEEAQQLRARLEAHYGPRHPVILDCDRLIRFQAFKNRVRPDSGKGNG